MREIVASVDYCLLAAFDLQTSPFGSIHLTLLKNLLVITAASSSMSIQGHVLGFYIPIVICAQYGILLLEDLTEFVTVMACIAIDGQPAFGVIHRPFHSETGTCRFYFIFNEVISTTEEEDATNVPLFYSLGLC